MAARRISPLDGIWLQLESRDTPMHVGALMEFTPGRGGSEAFVQHFREARLSTTPIPPPWNLAPLDLPLVGARLPALREIVDIDLDHHVRLWGLPTPGGQRELGEMVSWLHSQPLDLRRPLWEAHVIEGLEDDRCAVYLKIHHALIDGASGMLLIPKALSLDPDDKTPAFWQVGADESSRPAPTTGRSPFDTAMRAPRAMAGLGRSAVEMLRGSVDGRPLRAPYRIAKSPLAETIRGQRRFATQSYPLETVKALAKAGDCTLNDVVLYLCGTALRNYLAEFGEVPDRTLTAGIPVSLREPGDERIGTSVGLIVADLGTHLDDPLERLRSIAESTASAKRNLRKMPSEALALQTVAINGPYIAGMVAGMGSRAPIPFNVTVSNVPGPRTPLYSNGARMDAMYPISLLTQGTALNITCMSYAGTIDFGFVGARDVLPHLQHLAVHMGAGLEELSALLLTPAI